MAVTAKKTYHCWPAFAYAGRQLLAISPASFQTWTKVTLTVMTQCTMAFHATHIVYEKLLFKE
eukprot:194041-Prorocentrum_lima.AAC.1